MIPFWCGVLDRRANLTEQGQPGGQVEAVPVAVLRDRDPLDQLHHKERPAALGCAGVEDAGDVGMVHHGQRLRSDSNRARTFRESIPGLISFRATMRRIGRSLLGQVNGAHPPLANLLAELVAIRNDRIDRGRRLLSLGRSRSGAVVDVPSRTGRSVGLGPRPRHRLGIGDKGPIQGEWAAGHRRP